MSDRASLRSTVAVSKAAHVVQDEDGIWEATYFVEHLAAAYD